MQEYGDTVTKLENERQAEMMEYTISGRVGQALAPIFKPIGFDWKLTTASIGALAAKEVFVSQLGILYAEGEKTAREEGFDEIAETFHHVINSEQHHYNRYKKLLENIKNDTVFKKPTEVVWMCRECGYLFKGKSAPQKCPNCHHPQAYFQIFSENY